jgi:hypothetical protein
MNGQKIHYDNHLGIIVAFTLFIEFQSYGLLIKKAFTIIFTSLNFDFQIYHGKNLLYKRVDLNQWLSLPDC